MMTVCCPDCMSPVAIAENHHGDAVCPLCGSSISFDLGSTATWGGQHQHEKLGRFQLLKVVGVGAFGSVYQARDPQLDRIVAIKMPRSGELTLPVVRDRFVREARSVAQLHHPGIVPLYEVGQVDGVPFLVSEFVHGVTLADLLTARRFSFREAAQLVAAVADALQYAHERGVIHRDVKPANIMLQFDGEQQGIAPAGPASSSVAAATQARSKNGPPSASSLEARTTRSSDSPIELESRFRPRLTDFGLARRDAGDVTRPLKGRFLVRRRT